MLYGTRSASLDGGETAGPSTTLRSGRDDNSVAAGTDAMEKLQQNCHLEQVPCLRQVKDGTNAAFRLYPVDRSRGAPYLARFGEMWDTATVS